MCKRLLFLTIIFFVILLTFPVAKVWSATSCPTDKEDPCKGLSEQECSDVINACSTQAYDLSSQIETVRGNIALTSLRISQTEQQIVKLTDEITSISAKIENLESSLTTLSNVFIERIIASYKNSFGNNDLAQLLFNSPKLYDLLVNLRYLQIVQRNDRKIIFLVESTKVNYGEQKKVREQKKQEQTQLETKLASQKVYLAQQKDKLQIFLSSTQSVLDKARIQLEAIRSLARLRSGGGKVSLLSNQTSCNDWGCYYNQRDSSWGQKFIGSSNESMAEVGCLVTSVSMILTHYGKRDVTPADVAQTLDAFVPGTAYMWFRSWSVKGATVNRSSQSISTSSIDSELSQGRPVIVGLYNGPAHFVVLKSGSGGNYTMNDPWFENAHDVKFSDHYSVSNITEVDYVSIN